MKLRDLMPLTNITCDETSGVDIGGKWLGADMCHIAFRFNEDDKDDVEFHMLLDRYDLETLRDFIEMKLGTQPGKLN